jgi:adenine C2-methylase RlmN of 23S rRNA A2503 and tRNA A37
MEVYRTKDGQVSKYVHDDGSETAIKATSSCANDVDPETGRIVPVEIERNKFSVFISSSVGCPLGCRFCYLTVRKYPYHKLSAVEIIKNVSDALTAEFKHKPELRNKYMKLSWMGMGDPMLLNPREVKDISLEICKRATTHTFLNKFPVIGVDGVDIATVMPKNLNTGWPHQYNVLNDCLDKFNVNPSSKGRSKVRLFYSLHGMNERKELIPALRFNSPIIDLQELNKFSNWYGIDIMLHNLLLEGVNDSNSTMNKIVLLIRNLIPNAELRILRYNECENSPFKESKKFDALVKLYAKALAKVKYQTSSGSEIEAACGQFLCKELKGASVKAFIVKFPEPVGFYEINMEAQKIKGSSLMTLSPINIENAFAFYDKEVAEKIAEKYKAEIIDFKSR